MKRQTRYLTVPLHIWTHPDLSINEKVVLIELDSYCIDDTGVEVGIQTISSSCGLSAKDVKASLKSLYEKSALTIEIDDYGKKKVIPYLNLDRYVTDPNKVVKTEKKVIDVFDYGYIQEQWNNICTTLAKIERFTPRRKQKTRTCVQGCGVGTEELIKAFKLISSSSFLNGSKTKWAASFDWLVKSPDNLQKVLEGNYHKSDFTERQAYESIMHGINGLEKETGGKHYRDYSPYK